MRRMMLVGPSRAGKTSLCQCLCGEVLHERKTQTIVWSPTSIDTPGEYLENRRLYSALLASASEAEIIALVLHADAVCSPFTPGFTEPMNRPTIGVVTKADVADAVSLARVAGWLEQAGGQRIFITSARMKRGIADLLAFLNAEASPCLTP
ncbi:EutP/PduV family microcompartment system protein [Edwardsiella tarda]|uniref:EutP/PduV family microcompartment system protein n=1 Tax=Edwardsiella tarda TaxID=636 RepID=UPI00098EF5E0|nr:EutP/PduV family microcompartment system protein [Edwardsiella tarda]